MYQTIIKIKDGLPQDVVTNIYNKANQAFNNRAGKANNISKDPLTLLFEGGESLFGCLQLGILDLYQKGGVVEFLRSWDWVDFDEPDENYDVIYEMSIPVN